MQIISNVALISINETMIVLLVSFLLFLFIINRVMFRPLRGVMTERESYMQQIQQEIDQAEADLEKSLQETRQQEATARKSAFRRREVLEEQGREEAQKIFAQARTTIDQLKDQAAQDIAGQVSEARQKLQQDAAGLTAQIMEKILDRRMTE